MRRVKGYQKTAAKHPKPTHATTEPIGHAGGGHPIPSMQFKVFKKTRKARLTQSRHRA